MNGITNVEAILGAADDPKLAPGEIDAVLIRNAYHEMPEYRAVLAGVTRALRPGGTLIVSEAIRDQNRAKTREQQVKEHEIAPELVEAELREAGFEIVERQDSFTTFTRPPPGGYWMIRARRPASKQSSPAGPAPCRNQRKLTGTARHIEQQRTRRDAEKEFLNKLLREDPPVRGIIEGTADLSPCCNVQWTMARY